MKIYARQINPEYQQSPLFYEECFPDDIAVCGNKRFNSHMCDVFERVKKTLDDGELAEILADLQDGGYYADVYEDSAEAIEEFLGREDGEKYDAVAIYALEKLVLRYGRLSREEDDILCEVLSFVTNEKWNCRQITGCCQGDWQIMYYPVDQWTKEAIDVFEIEYFNEGSEWIIHDEEYVPESAEDINGYSLYCTAWDDDEIKKEIAEVTEVESPEDVVLYKYDGEIRIPKYKLV